ncbi:MAG: hypothetical protein D6690_17900 [Nitrospirae bacterium]|nr:MAG: hypothetical protein D6690_17900 [Nitrospirota bacterium]
MTKFLIPALGWVYLVMVLDWYAKKIIGWDLSLPAGGRNGRWPFCRGVQAEFPQGGTGCRAEAGLGQRQSAHRHRAHGGDEGLGDRAGLHQL